MERVERCKDWNHLVLLDTSCLPSVTRVFWNSVRSMDQSDLFALQREGKEMGIIVQPLFAQRYDPVSDSPKDLIIPNV